MSTFFFRDLFNYQAFPSLYTSFLTSYRQACAIIDRQGHTVDANANSISKYESNLFVSGTFVQLL
jgi:hypothetical protein